VLLIGGALTAFVGLGMFEAARQGLIDAPAGSLAVVTVLGAIAFVAGLVLLARRQLAIRRVLPPERYRGPSVFILLVLAMVIAALISAPFGADARVLESGEGNLSLLGSIALLIGIQTGLLLVSYLFVLRPRALSGLPSFPGGDAGGAVLRGLGWGVVAWLGSTLVAGLVVWLLTELGAPPQPEVAQRAIAQLDPILVALAVVVLAPIAEEVFFRGIVFNAWLREGGRRWAYVGSAALFALVHLSFVTLLPIFLLGLALAWVYDRTRNLLAPIVMHATVNGISVLIALLERFGVIQLPAV
jgi:uncharacterized protein